MPITFEKVLILKNISIFDQASEMALADLITVSEEKTYRENETILDNTDINAHLYIILGGHVQLMRDNDVLSERGARQFFGETTVLHPAPMSCRVIATERTTVLRIPSQQLYQMMALHPTLARGFLGELSKRLHQEQVR